MKLYKLYEKFISDKLSIDDIVRDYAVDVLDHVNELEVLTDSYRFNKDLPKGNVDFIYWSYFNLALLHRIYAKLMKSDAQAHYYAKKLAALNEAILRHEHLLPRLASEAQQPLKIEPPHEDHGRFYNGIKKLTSQLQDKFSWLNWGRLQILRWKRLFEAVGDAVKSVENYQAFVAGLDKMSPTFKVLAFAFYLPDLAIELYFLLKHTVNGPWLTEEEKALGWFNRLSMQLKRRWPKIANHSLWITAGVLSYTVVAAGTVAAASLLVSLYCADIVVSALKSYQEYRRYNRAIQNLEAERKSTGYLDERRRTIDWQIESLKQAQKDCVSQIKLSVGTATGLFIGMAVSQLPIFLAAAGFAGAVASGPALPIVGAAIVLAVCGYFLYRKIKMHYEKPAQADIQLDHLHFAAERHSAQVASPRPGHQLGMPSGDPDLEQKSGASSSRNGSYYQLDDEHNRSSVDLAGQGGSPDLARQESRLANEDSDSENAPLLVDAANDDRILPDQASSVIREPLLHGYRRLSVSTAGGASLAESLKGQTQAPVVQQRSDELPAYVPPAYVPPIVNQDAAALDAQEGFRPLAAAKLTSPPVARNIEQNRQSGSNAATVVEAVVGAAKVVGFVANLALKS